jgi:hypothetical protein
MRVCARFTLAALVAALLGALTAGGPCFAVGFSGP